MTRTSLEDLQDEYASAGIGVLIYREILYTASATCGSGAYPTSYSPNGVWDDESIDDLAHSWATRRLLPHTIPHFLLSSTTIHHFRAQMERSFRQFLINQRQRTAGDNLYTRILKVLDITPTSFRCFVATQRPGHNQWGLLAWLERQLYTGHDSTLHAISIAILPALQPLYNRADSRKYSSVISTPDLVRFLEELLTHIDHLLTPQHMISALHYRFHLTQPSSISLDIPVGDNGTATLHDLLSDSHVVTGTALLAEEMLAEVLLALTPRQTTILRLRVQQDLPITAIAAQLGCSKSTVSNELRAVMHNIGAIAGSLETASSLWVLLQDALAGAVTRV